MRTFEPRAYQAYAIRRIVEEPAVGLMLDMGMGKTVVTLTAIAELMHERFAVQRTLVIAPKHVAEATWADEAAAWAHTRYLRLSLVLGSEAARRAALSADADIYIVNRENVIWLVTYYGRKWPFDMVVIDEASSFKNPAAKRFKALRRVRPLFRRIVELTGTPSPNGLLDLWSQMYLLDGGARLEKQITRYRLKYFRPERQSGHIVYSWRPREGAEAEILRRISDICVSMRSEDYLTLPPALHQAVRVRLPEEAAAAYRKFERELVMELAGGEVTAASAASLANKLLQFANGAVYLDGEGRYAAAGRRYAELHAAKLGALAEIVEANAGQPILVFYWFGHDLERLRRAFPQAEALEGAEDIRRWNAGQIPLLLAHPASAGHGLNLQNGGHIAVWFGLTWSLELYQQANKRLHRPGQRETVTVCHLAAAGTIDETVLQALTEKAAGQTRVLEAVRARIGREGA